MPGSVIPADPGPRAGGEPGSCRERRSQPQDPVSAVHHFRAAPQTRDDGYGEDPRALSLFEPLIGSQCFRPLASAANASTSTCWQASLAASSTSASPARWLRAPGNIAKEQFQASQSDTTYDDSFGLRSIPMLAQPFAERNNSSIGAAIGRSRWWRREIPIGETSTRSWCANPTTRHPGRPRPPSRGRAGILPRAPFPSRKISDSR
jgi:hypothetical protein